MKKTPDPFSDPEGRVGGEGREVDGASAEVLQGVERVGPDAHSCRCPT